MSTITPRLITVQRDAMSKQLKDGFLIFHIEADSYEEWEATTKEWKPFGGGSSVVFATQNDIDSGDTNGKVIPINLLDDNFISEDEIFQNTDQVTQLEAQQDWDAI
jgi:hypothetical protein